jgi:hypothetical protein
MGDDTTDDMKRSFENVAEESVRKARSVMMADHDEQKEGRKEGERPSWRWLQIPGKY